MKAILEIGADRDAVKLATKMKAVKTRDGWVIDDPESYGYEYVALKNYCAKYGYAIEEKS